MAVISPPYPIGPDSPSRGMLMRSITVPFRAKPEVKQS
jgi:hypothetical protein